MNTTTAAEQANVTVATIRTWCARGVVKAAKVAGRWAIDTASLAYRIGLPQLLRKARKAVTLTVETMIALGGRLWEKNGMRRVYLNDWPQYADLDIDYYKTGNVNGATLGGRAIANNRAAKLIGAVDKIWFDAATGQLHARHYGADAVEVRYLDGTRQTIDLITRIFSGIKTAAAAL